jgi:hypothetical protein
MNRETRRRLFSLLVLAALVTGILVLPPTQTKAYAAFCCEYCPTIFENCMAGTLNPQCHGDDACCSEWVDRICATCLVC